MNPLRDQITVVDPGICEMSREEDPVMSETDMWLTTTHKNLVITNTVLNLHFLVISES